MSGAQFEGCTAARQGRIWALDGKDFAGVKAQGVRLSSERAKLRIDKHVDRYQGLDRVGVSVGQFADIVSNNGLDFPEIF
jgi:hypothetical protein